MIKDNFCKGKVYPELEVEITNTFYLPEILVENMINVSEIIDKVFVAFANRRLARIVFRVAHNLVVLVLEPLETQNS